MELATFQGGDSAEPLVHDRLVQQQIPGNTNSAGIQSLLGAKPLGGGDIPIVLIPQPRSFFSFGVEVPSGPVSLMQVAGKDNREAPTGYQPWFFTSRVAYIVTTQSINYNCPVKECPTKDNVMISVDVVVSFNISDPRTFVYKMGAARADTLLVGAVDELMRGLVRSITHDKAYELKGAQANLRLPELNKKFDGAGIFFSSITITTVRLPKDIEDSLQKITNQERLIQKLQLDYDNNVPKWRTNGEQQVQAIQSSNKVREVDENNKKEVLDEEYKRVQSALGEEANEQIAKAEEKVQAMKEAAMGNLRRASDLAASNKTRDLNKAKNEEQTIKIKADEAFRVGVLSSQEELAQAHRTAQSIRRDAEVEINLEEQVMLKRRHEITLAQRRVLAELAEKGDYNLIGAAGDDMLKSLLGGEFGVLVSG